MKKIKVAFDATAIPVHLTGAGFYVKEVLHKIDGFNKIELIIVTKRSDKERFQNYAPNSKIIDIAPSGKIARVGFQNLRLGSLVDSLDVDLFHGPHYQIPRNLKTKSVVTIHDMTLLTHKNVHTSVKTQYFKWIIPHAINRSSGIITVSQSTADDVLNLFPESKNIFVAPLGVDTNRFHPEKSDNEIELLKNRGIQGNYIAFIGLFEPRKFVPTLIEAFAKVANQIEDYKLVLAGGKGWGANEIKNSISNSGIATRIITPGRLSDEEVGPFLRNAKIFVYPSIYEGFGMPVLESMACGTPTITTNSSSLKEVAGKGALLFEPENSDQLSELIISLLNNKTIYQQMSNKAIARSKDFSWENCATQHLLAYEKAIS